MSARKWEPVKASDVRPGDLAHRKNSDLDARPVEAVIPGRPRQITLKIGSLVTPPIPASLYRFTREVTS